MYALDLNDSRLNLPTPIYTLEHMGQHLLSKKGLRPGDGSPEIAFYAPEKSADLLPMWWSDAACRTRQLRVGGDPQTPVLFYALPSERIEETPNAVPLKRFVGADGSAYYGVSSRNQADTVTATIAGVWANPQNIHYPVGDYLWPLQADAGEDQCWSLGVNTDVVVPLSASASSHKESTIDAYRWYSGDTLLAEGQEVDVLLHAGLHALRLEVESDGAKASDDILIRIY
jgi:hypothetical protein